MLKAYKIKTKADVGYSIYIAKNAGKAKTMRVILLKDHFRDADYSWVTSCRRAPEFDYLAQGNQNACIAWRLAGENWQIDRGHWWGGAEPSPVTPPNIVCSGLATPSASDKGSAFHASR